MLNMKMKTPMKCSLTFLPILVLLQCCLFACAPGFINGSPVETIEIKAENVQRDGVPLTIENLSTGDAYWEWQLIDSEDGSIEEISTDFSPNLTLEKGRYDVLVTAKNGNDKSRDTSADISPCSQRFLPRARPTKSLISQR